MSPHRLIAPATNARWQAIAIIVLIALFIVDGRARDVGTRTRSVQACERARVDRAVQRAGWRTAEIARRSAAADPAQASGRKANLAAAAEYDRYVTDLSRRIDPPFACQRAFPKVSMFGVKLGASVPIEPVIPLRPIPSRMR